MSGYFSGGRVGLAEAFPTIKNIDVTVETGAGITRFDKKETFRYSLKFPPPALIPCPRGGCTGSGFDFQSMLMQMVALKQTEKTETRMCNGQEKMGRGHFRSCLGNFSVTIKIEYHNAAA
jgi:hypothetical protein